MLHPPHHHTLTPTGYLTMLFRTWYPSDVERDSISRLPHDCHTWLTNATYHHETARDILQGYMVTHPLCNDRHQSSWPATDSNLSPLQYKRWQTRVKPSHRGLLITTQPLSRWESQWKMN